MLDFNDVVAVPVRYDLDEIVHRLRTTAESWVPRHFPNGRRLGDEWRLANIQGAPPRNSGSCVITLVGEHAGNWHEFDGGQGGGPLSTLEQALGLDGTALFAEAARLTGWSATAPAREAPPMPPPAKRDASPGDRLHPRSCDGAPGHGRRALPREPRAWSCRQRPISAAIRT